MIFVAFQTTPTGAKNVRQEKNLTTEQVENNHNVKEELIQIGFTRTKNNFVI